MFRTRDLALLVVSIMLTMVVMIVAVLLTQEPEQGSSAILREVRLSTPKDSYAVVPYEKENSLHNERDAFIEKVKRTYVPRPLDNTEPIPQPADGVTPKLHTPPIATTTPPEIFPPIPVPPTDTATVTPYGNTNF